MRLRPSQYVGLPSTVYFEYPRELQITRGDVNVVEKLGNRKLFFKCYWERICIKNAFLRAGFMRSTNSNDDKDGNSNDNNTISTSSSKKSSKKDKSDCWTALWSKHQNVKQISMLNCLQKINHFPMSWCVGRKDRLVRTLNTMKRVHGNEFDFHPESYILPSERSAFMRQVKMDINIAKSRGGPGECSGGVV